MEGVEAIIGSVGAAGGGNIASQRSYRSRRNRPCDRCRSRKQRCVIPTAGSDLASAVAGNVAPVPSSGPGPSPSAGSSSANHQPACLNCSLAGAECTFDEPATKRIRAAASNANLSGGGGRGRTSAGGLREGGSPEDSDMFDGEPDTPPQSASNGHPRPREGNYHPGQPHYYHSPGSSGMPLPRSAPPHLGPPAPYHQPGSTHGHQFVGGSSSAAATTGSTSSAASTTSSAPFQYKSSLSNGHTPEYPVHGPSNSAMGHRPLPPMQPTRALSGPVPTLGSLALNGSSNHQSRSDSADRPTISPTNESQYSGTSTGPQHQHHHQHQLHNPIAEPEPHYLGPPSHHGPATVPHRPGSGASGSTYPNAAEHHYGSAPPPNAVTYIPPAATPAAYRVPAHPHHQPAPAASASTAAAGGAPQSSSTPKPIEEEARKAGQTNVGRNPSPTSNVALQGEHHHPNLSDIFMDIVTSSRQSLGSGPDPPTDVQAYRSLDSDAGEDFELHFIGATSERDALVLSAVASLSRTSGHTVATSTYRMRQVSEDPVAPVIFLFNPTKTYDEAYIESHLHVRDPLVALEQLLGVGRLPSLIQKFLELDGQAIPLWSEESIELGSHPSKSLQACYICTAVIYFPELRHLAPAAWSISVNNIRALPNRARLATIQANLLDLAGRPSVNRRVNLLRLGETVAAARLLALHLDCSQWKIPPWEKRLRTRLWWALLMHDKWLALCHGHSSSISVHEWNVGLPRASNTDPPSYRSFILLCELTMLLDEALSTLCSVRTYESDGRRPDWKLATVADLGRRLDAWRAQMDQLINVVRMSLGPDDTLPPGFQSLKLSYHAVAMLLSRTALDTVTGNEMVGGSAAISAQQGVLQVAEDVVDFVCGLRAVDFAGYWSVYCSAHLSKTLILLVRLTIQADRSDRSKDSVWTRTLHALRRFLTTLANAQRDHAWDIADLAIARARDIVPLLMQQIPELEVVLSPFRTSMPPPATNDFADTFDLSQVFSGFGEAWDGSQPFRNWYPIIAGGLWHSNGLQQPM